MGINRADALYKMAKWEINAAIRGYYRRNRAMWEATRFQTFSIVRALGGCQNKATPQDWFKYTWEEKKIKDEEGVGDIPSLEEANKIREQIRLENEMAERRRKEQ